MRYWVSTFAGLLICGASLVAVSWGLYHLVRTGTCASGGPYVSARPCPPGTGGHIGALVGGIFGGLAGIAVYAIRGGRGRPGRIGIGMVMWSLLFLSLAASSLVAAFGPAAEDRTDSKTGAIVLSAIFIPMGLVPLPFALFARGKARQARALLERGRRCPGRVVSIDDTGVTINDNPRVKITVEAQPPGEPAFTVVKTSVVSRVNIPRPGDACTVFYDPNDRERTGITFDPVPDNLAAAAAAAAAAGLGANVLSPQPVWPLAPAPGAPPIVAGGSPAAPPAADGDDDDVLEQLQKLGELRATGVLTESEFEEQKRKLLGEL